MTDGTEAWRKALGTSKRQQRQQRGRRKRGLATVSGPGMVRLSTTQRGYGSEHRRERERRLALYRPGDICAHGGEPLTWWPLAYARQFLDLPHTPDRSGYLPGLSCRKHNRGEANRRRGVARAWRTSRRW